MRVAHGGSTEIADAGLDVKSAIGLDDEQAVEAYRSADEATGSHAEAADFVAWHREVGAAPDRLLPLGAVTLAFLILNSLPLKWYLGLLGAAVLYAVLIANVCYVARERDYS